MRVLLVGGGGREHALAWKLAQSPIVTRLFCAPGNPGIAVYAECLPIRSTDCAALISFARAERIGLAVVGPESPLIAGLVDAMSEVGIPAFGPSARAARLEGSKAFAKDLMVRHGVPTAPHAVFTEPDAASDYARAQAALGRQLVVKASGEALGKGAIVTDSLDDALAAIHMLMVEKALGGAAAVVVIEQRLRGFEASMMAFTDGGHVRMMPTAQDFKRALDGNRGPNTGGMGAYSPVGAVTPEMAADVEEKVVRRTVQAMAAEGVPYKGVLYPGMLFEDGRPVTLEFNCRFGDPETQVLMPLLETDLVEIALAVIEGRLDSLDIRWSPRACISVVLASGGYPGEYRTGMPIEGVEAASEMPGVTVFHGGTAVQNGRLVTAGGRALNVSAVADTVAAARVRAYNAVEQISFEGAQFRRDIAANA